MICKSTHARREGIAVFTEDRIPKPMRPGRDVNVVVRLPADADFDLTERWKIFLLNLQDRFEDLACILWQPMGDPAASGDGPVSAYVVSERGLVTWHDRSRDFAALSGRLRDLAYFYLVVGDEGLL